MADSTSRPGYDDSDDTINLAIIEPPIDSSCCSGPRKSGQDHQDQDHQDHQDQDQDDLALVLEDIRMFASELVKWPKWGSGSEFDRPDGRDLDEQKIEELLLRQYYQKKKPGLACPSLSRLQPQILFVMTGPNKTNVSSTTKKNNAVAACVSRLQISTSKRSKN